MEPVPGGCRLVVEDDGPGFAGATVLGRESPGGSTGLGLDIARRAAERTGGSLALAGSPSGGARVELIFGDRRAETKGVRLAQA